MGGTRKGSGGRARKPALAPDPLSAHARRALHLVVLPSTGRRRAAGARKSPAAVDTTRQPASTVHDLLTDWISTARGVQEPDTLDDCADYSRYLDEVNRAKREVDALCRSLRERLAQWVEDETRFPPFTAH
jgi:hypothetical protein